MDHRRLETIGEQLRSLGHDRREVVQELVIEADGGGNADDIRRLYGHLDRISERCMGLLQEQRDLIARALGAGDS